MQKLGAGYTMYFNEKNKRSGVLFQGKYKSILIKTDEYGNVKKFRSIIGLAKFVGNRPRLGL